MVFGPKTNILLQRPTSTDAAGTTTVTWSNVETISAVMRPFSEGELLIYGRDAVLTMRKVYIDYSGISEPSRQYLTPKSRMQIDSTNYDIESVELFDGPGKHYRLILRKVK